jgi:hypothetical protein
MFKHPDIISGYTTRNVSNGSHLFYGHYPKCLIFSRVADKGGFYYPRWAEALKKVMAMKH